MRRNHTQGCPWPSDTHKHMHLHIHMHRNTQNKNKLSTSICMWLHAHAYALHEYKEIWKWRGKTKIPPLSVLLTRTNHVFRELDNSIFQRGKYMGTTQDAWELVLTRSSCNYYLVYPHKKEQRTQNQQANKAILLSYRHGSEAQEQSHLSRSQSRESGRPDTPELPLSSLHASSHSLWFRNARGTNSKWSLHFPTHDILFLGPWVLRARYDIQLWQACSCSRKLQGQRTEGANTLIWTEY